jgi:hypothetical protein
LLLPLLLLLLLRRWHSLGAPLFGEALHFGLTVVVHLTLMHRHHISAA